MPPKAMLIAGAALILLAVPPLLFFAGCAAPPEADAPLKVNVAWGRWHELDGIGESR